MWQNNKSIPDSERKLSGPSTPGIAWKTTFWCRMSATYRIFNSWVPLERTASSPPKPFTSHKVLVWVCDPRNLPQFTRHRLVQYQESSQNSNLKTLILKDSSVISIWTYLILSLPQPVKFPGLKMQGCACKQHIFQSYKKSTFTAIRLDESPFTCHCEKENRKA